MIGLFAVIMLVLMNFENDILRADSPSVNNLNGATRERFLLPLLLRQLLLKLVLSSRVRWTLKPLVIIWICLPEVRCTFMYRDLWIPIRYRIWTLCQSVFSASVWLNDPPRVLCGFLKRLKAQFPHGLLNFWHDILHLRLLMSHDHGLIARALWVQSAKLRGVDRSLRMVTEFLHRSLSTKLDGGWRFLLVLRRYASLENDFSKVIYREWPLNLWITDDTFILTDYGVLVTFRPQMIVDATSLRVAGHLGMVFIRIVFLRLRWTDTFHHLRGLICLHGVICPQLILVIMMMVCRVIKNLRWNRQLRDYPLDLAEKGTEGFLLNRLSQYLGLIAGASRLVYQLCDTRVRRIGPGSPPLGAPRLG